MPEPALCRQPNPPEPAVSLPESPAELLHIISVEHGATFNICEILKKAVDGKSIVAVLEKNHPLSINERRCMVRILVSHLIERSGENPTSGMKTCLASSIVDQFPTLRDCHGRGYDAWFTPGRRHKPATGFLEERLRNIRKRLRAGRRGPAPAAQKADSCIPLVLPEPTITPERAIELTQWLKNNVWPASQVGQYMLETSLYRAQWIRANGTTPVPLIINEFPRLVDTPGMISQDFSSLHPEAARRLTESWKTMFTPKILCLAKKEKTGDLLNNVAEISADKQGDIALQLLPLLLPTGHYKMGKKVFRPSSLEIRKAFIQVQPVGTNMVDYLSRLTTDIPFVLMLGSDNNCSQAFVVVNGIALEYITLLGAVDGCFKAFYVFDVAYPKACSQVWEFLQTVVFGIPGPESNAVKLMRAQLAGM